MSNSISRRDFLKATAVGLAGVATVGVSGIVTAESSPVESGNSNLHIAQGESRFAPTDGDYTYGAFINKQNEDGMNDSGSLEHLFSPLKIGGVTLKNRIVKSAAGSEMQDNCEWPSDTALAYYGQYCKGGIGMVCYESSNCIPMPTMEMPVMGGMPADGAILEGENQAPPVGMNALDISTDAGIPAHKAIADYMHSLDTPLVGQLYDMLMTRGASSTAIHEFELETSFASGKMQTTQEVQQEIQCFIDAGERYFKAGYDGVEINASCSHYFSTYLSRFANNERTDQYSGETIENRARVITEVIEGIRKRVGNDFIIQILYSGVEENIANLGQNEYCTSVEEACEFAKLFEKAGASSLHIRSQAYGHHCAGFMPDALHIHEHGHTGYGTVLDYGKHFQLVQGQYDGYGALIEVAARIKSCVSIPVGTVGAMDPRITPDLIDGAIAHGKIDFILLTRPLMADPDYCNKLKEGRKDEIAPCTRCMTCFVAPIDFGTPMYCRVNASLTRAFTPDMPEGYEPLKADPVEKVVVIGAGPAGMEAARIAAKRGHDVTIYEKEESLGFTLDNLSKIKGPHERIQDHKAFLIGELERNNVKIVTGKEVTVEDIEKAKPDSIIVAVGGDFAPIECEGAQSQLIINADMLSGDVEGDEFVVIGAQFQGCEAAVNLVKRGKKVTVINFGSQDQMYMNASTWVRTTGKKWLLAKGVKFWHNARIKSIEADSVRIICEAGLEITIHADAVVNALPKLSNRKLYDDLQKVFSKVYMVGDCYAPSTIANAIARANIVARNVEKSIQTVKTLEGGSGVYTAKSSGIGEVTVSVRIDEGKITEAAVDTSAETLGIGRNLGGVFEKAILEKGTVDSVSGATVTSNAVQKALDDCLKQAGLR